MSNALDARTVSAMQTGEPFATYKKTTVGQVAVELLSPFSGEPEGLILSGDGDESMIDVWSAVEDLFFRRRNRRHFERGTIIKITKEPVEEVHTIEQYTDDELKEVLNKKPFSFNKILSEVTSEAVAQRLLDIARKEEKSERLINQILTKLSELQLQ